MSDQPYSWIQEIRTRLEQPAPKRLPAGEERRAAVLVPLDVDAGELWTILTKRAESLPHHKSQIAFPGGGLELGEDAWTAALRESHEEVGIDPSTVLRLGQLDEAGTPSGFRIVPCVGSVRFPLSMEINEGEIEEQFSVPVLAFANPNMVEDRLVLIDGVERMIRIYHVGRHQVWGLTARILQNLMQRLGFESAEEAS